MYHSTYYPESVVRTLRSRNEAWAEAWKQQVVAAAEPWRTMSDDMLWEMMFGTAHHAGMAGLVQRALPGLSGTVTRIYLDHRRAGTAMEGTMSALHGDFPEERFCRLPPFRPR